jgi:MSHA type pilus biogenesis protein MshL
MRRMSRLSFLATSALLAACASPPAPPPTPAHLQKNDLPAAGDIPPPVQQTLNLPLPKPAVRSETYSVVVNNVRIHELLFALARDARINVDIHPGISGVVTLNAVDQTLPQILNRLAKQADLRWELDGPNLAVMPDTPYLQNYKVDYVNMKRDTSGSIQVSGEIAETTATTGGGSSGNNGSTAKIDNSSKNHFWETLVQNIKDLLRETDKILPEGSSETVVEQASNQQGAAVAPPAQTSNNRNLQNRLLPPTESAGTTVVKRATFREAASVIANPETGTLSVRATSRQQEKIQQFLDQVMRSARRQVLIEATIAEVELTSQYQQGVDWGRFAASANSNGLFFSQAGAPVVGSGLLTLTGRGSSGDGSISGAVRLLETFGTVKVLSSPKISAINNQSAILKVVDNQVYFTVKANTVTSGTNPPVTNFTTEQKVVPVGFVMNVTPQISEADEVVLNVRPSITRILKFEDDPNPSLISTNPTTGVQTKIPNLVPVIRTREMESIIRIQDGNIAVMGGLMEEQIKNTDSAVPWFHTLPLIGALFTQKSDEKRKTELVVFLRPTVIRNDGMNGDYSRLREHLPTADFFANNPGPRYQLLPSQSDEAKK